MNEAAYVCILASCRNGTLYIGVSSDLVARTWQHREGILDGFTRQYGVKRLVHYECFGNFKAAIRREKAIKKWYRKWKLELIESKNPTWRDLWPDIYGSPRKRGPSAKKKKPDGL